MIDERKLRRQMTNFDISVDVLIAVNILQSLKDFFQNCSDSDFVQNTTSSFAFLG